MNVPGLREILMIYDETITQMANWPRDGLIPARLFPIETHVLELVPVGILCMKNQNGKRAV